MPLSRPVLDHAVVNAREGLDQVANLWRRLGFMLMPRRYHTLGSYNHLAVIGADHLELLGVQPGTTRTVVLDWPVALNVPAFKTYDAGATYDALHAARLPVLPPQAFSRSVELPEGSQDVTSRPVWIKPDATPEGRFFFCQHLTPTLVWKSAWWRHVNGALGILRVIIAAADPTGPAGLLRRMSGSDAAAPRDHGASMPARRAQVDILLPKALQAEFGSAALAADGRKAWIGALTRSMASLDSAESALATSGVSYTHGPAGIVVPASELGGMALMSQD